MFVFGSNHPKPRKFMYQFNDQGKLRFCSYAGIVLTNIMSKRGLLSIDDTIYKSQPLLISGAAKSYLRLKYEIQSVDSLSVNEEFEF
jgi:hypothetical protein